MPIPIEISASSRVSTKIGESFYTVEFMEKWSVQPDEKMETVRNDLWDTVNEEVDKQVEDILDAFKSR